MTTPNLAPTNPTGYPSGQEVDGNLAVKDPSKIGLYGNLSVDTAIFLNGKSITAGGGGGGGSGNAAVLDWADVTNPRFGNGGADPTGVNDSTAAIMAAYNSLPIAGSPGAGGTLYFPTGTYKVTQQLTFNPVAPIYIVGDGLGVSIIKFYSSVNYAACIRMYDNYVPTGGANSILVWGGGIDGITIDGSNATGIGACGLHIGDMKRKYFRRVQIQHFNGTSGGVNQVAVWVDNTKFWTEDCTAEFGLLDNAQAVVFDIGSSYSGSVSGTGTVDIDNNDWTFHMGGGATNQNGVLVTGGAFIYHSIINILGGLRSSASAGTNWAALQVGTNFVSGDGSAIYHSILNMRMESDGSGAHTPATIILAHAGNDIHGCTGYMNFMNGYGAATLNGQFAYDGFINGDNTLAGTSLSGAPAANGTKTNNGRPVIVSVSGGTGVTISIDGVTTNQSSGMFLLNPGHSFGCGNYTGAPTVAYLPIIPGL